MATVQQTQKSLISSISDKIDNIEGSRQTQRNVIFPKPVEDEPARIAPDGYVRISPVQPIGVAANYRKRIILQVLGYALLAAVVPMAVWLLLQTGIFAF